MLFFTCRGGEYFAGARQYATRKGWIVADEHVYVDDGISGAEFANRPGFLRLMNALNRGRRSRC
jgi:DNA invertase Pin-like site-specific DNA recombinase